MDGQWQAQPEQDLEHGELLGDEEPLDHKQPQEEPEEIAVEGIVICQIYFAVKDIVIWQIYLVVEGIIQKSY